jgi:hypothetical protein
MNCSAGVIDIDILSVYYVDSLIQFYSLFNCLDTKNFDFSVKIGTKLEVFTLWVWVWFESQNFRF